MEKNHYFVMESQSLKEGEIILPSSMKDEYEKMIQDGGVIIAHAFRFPIINGRPDHGRYLNIIGVSEEDKSEISIADSLRMGCEFNGDVITILLCSDKTLIKERV